MTSTRRILEKFTTLILAGYFSCMQDQDTSPTGILLEFLKEHDPNFPLDADMSKPLGIFWQPNREKHTLEAHYTNDTEALCPTSLSVLSHDGCTVVATIMTGTGDYLPVISGGSFMTPSYVKKCVATRNPFHAVISEHFAADATATEEDRRERLQQFQNTQVKPMTVKELSSFVAGNTLLAVHTGVTKFSLSRQIQKRWP